MRRKLTGCAVVFLLILLIPCVITLLIGHEAALPVSGAGEDIVGLVRLEGDGRRIDLQEYLIGVTAAQLSGDYSIEAIKAQMILNRTYYYRVLGDRSNLSGAELELTYLSEAERTAAWAAEGCEGAEENFLRAAVETDGLVMTCRRELAVAMYHRASSGVTRSLAEDYPYLHSVDSRYDLQMENYLTVAEYSTAVLKSKLESLCGAELTENGLQTGLQILEKDEAGYVETLLVGTEVHQGDAFAECLGLPSSAFSFQWLDSGRLQITCRGVGHGYGMSQYGANCMAMNGKTATEILKYYFQNVAVETWNRDE
ncbi:MAG: SpoIID/LytB domain-containing protein [Lachnospiraceae bacterium]|nr:SpoIID/LytB domain-containing protein [Lachnospiraceae bacterium]